MKKFYKLSIIFLSSFLMTANLIASQEIKILYKINNSIITNIDVEIAKESLIREKIKSDEIKKFFLIEKYENKTYMDSLLKNIYSKLNLSNISEFEIYLKNFNLTIEDVREKIKIEILWNQLISRKFQNQVIIDEDEIRQNVKKKKINYKEIIEYDLSEIVIAPQNEQELEKTIEKITETINSYGFETAANKFSISDTSKIGGNIGKIKENQLSDIIKNEIKKLEINEFSRPIYINNNYLIIKVNQKKKIEEKFDENKIVDEIIKMEKQKQYQNFSQIYFNKIKLNAHINEF